MSAEPGLFEALRRVSGTALSIFQSRFELASLELSVARSRLVESALIGLFGVLLLVVGIVALSVCVVLLLWDRMGLLALAGMGLIYLVAGFVLISKLRRHLRSQPRLFEATHAELQRDAAAFRGSSAAADPF